MKQIDTKKKAFLNLVKSPKGAEAFTFTAAELNFWSSVKTHLASEIKKPSATSLRLILAHSRKHSAFFAE